MEKNQTIPGFYSLRIYLTAIAMFILLVFPISTIMLFKYGPVWLEEKKTEFHDDSMLEILRTDRQNDGTLQATTSQKITIEPEDYQFQKSIKLFFRMMLLAVFLGSIWNYPFKRYLKHKRKKSDLPAGLQNYCRKWLLKVPLVNSLILGFAFLIPLVILALNIFGKQTDSISGKQFNQQFFIIALLSSFLSVLFVYFWFRHRVRFVYLEQVYDSLSLFKSVSKKYQDVIVRRLWINSIMTTLLPLSIVIFYLSLSKTGIRETAEGTLNADQIGILFGKYVPIIEQTNVFHSEHLFYVNAIDSLLMFVGIFTGILISIIYLFFFVNWTQKSIVVPIREVVEKMRHQGEGTLGRLAILRTNDELGELANGFNEMAMRIEQNINELKAITHANQRFVPEEFLEILGKEKITDVVLGDQVQKTMTVLFVDIQSFTTISEKMSPKENFDFLNDYLGFMEPLIRQHNGFIDKFIGDSIMALFGGHPQDAVNAALSMQQKLISFNNMLMQTGRSPINTGAGIHTGILILGVVGGEGRIETTVISDAVNLASRLERLTRQYQTQIIVSEKTMSQLDPGNYQYQFLDEVAIKGRVEKERIFAIYQKV